MSLSSLTLHDPASNRHLWTFLLDPDTLSFCQHTHIPQQPALFMLLLVEHVFRAPDELWTRYKVSPIKPKLWLSLLLQSEYPTACWTTRPGSTKERSSRPVQGGIHGSDGHPVSLIIDSPASHLEPPLCNFLLAERESYSESRVGQKSLETPRVGKSSKVMQGMWLVMFIRNVLPDVFQ